MLIYIIRFSIVNNNYNYAYSVVLESTTYYVIIKINKKQYAFMTSRSFLSIHQIALCVYLVHAVSIHQLSMVLIDKAYN